MNHNDNDDDGTGDAVDESHCELGDRVRRKCVRCPKANKLYVAVCACVCVCMNMRFLEHTLSFVYVGFKYSNS